MERLARSTWVSVVPGSARRLFLIAIPPETDDEEDRLCECDDERAAFPRELCREGESGKVSCEGLLV
jgi:hypothetical protein